MSTSPITSQIVIQPQVGDWGPLPIDFSTTIGPSSEVSVTVNIYGGTCSCNALVNGVPKAVTISAAPTWGPKNNNAHQPSSLNGKLVYKQTTAGKGIVIFFGQYVAPGVDILTISKDAPLVVAFLN